MPKDSSRPLASFPASSSDFALPSPGVGSSSSSTEEPNVLLQRFRRPSLLQKAGYMSESRLHSPLATSFTLHSRRRSQSTAITEESESDKERMMTDSPSSSEVSTPPLKAPGGNEEEVPKPTLPKPPSTPPRRRSSAASNDGADIPVVYNRRLSYPVGSHSLPVASQRFIRKNKLQLRPPRILHLLGETRPEEAEVKSEAAFQRLIASCSELPAQPRTPRSFVDRGRYPEEAVNDDPPADDDQSDDDDEPEAEETPFAYTANPSATQPIAIKYRTRTPGGSIASSINGDDMSISETSSSFGGGAMDVDMAPLGSPLLPSFTPTSVNHWRYTPPPTATAVRSNKRKLEDRFDPYPSSSKRRAVSPSIHHLRDSHSTTGSPITRSSNSHRLPIAIPIAIPVSAASSATSSPTISNAYPTYSRVLGITSSPTLRSSMSISSPILRPIARRREEEEEQRQIEGAGQAVRSLDLNGTNEPFPQPTSLEATSTLSGAPSK